MAKTPNPVARQTLRYRGKDYDGNYKYSYVPRSVAVGVEGVSQSRCPFLKVSRQALLAALTASSREILVHYFPAFPGSLDNASLPDAYEDYLTPGGAGDTAGYGGYLRERPQYQAPILDATSPADQEYEDAQMREELMRLSRLGVSVVTPDILGSPQIERAQRCAALIDAEFPDMKFAPMLDMNSATVAADYISAANFTDLFTSAANRWLDPDDGNMIVACFETSGPNFTGTQWGDYIAYMLSQYATGVNIMHVGQILGVPSKLDTLLTDLETHTAGYAARMPYVGPWGAGYSAYGDTTLPLWKGQVEGGVTYAQSMDFVWPITPQVVRAKSNWYQGAENFDTLLNQLQGMVSGDPSTWPRFANIVTWNDVSEATHFVPTPTNGGAYERLLEYYLQYFATESEPVITQDTIFYSYRSQLTTATPVGGAAQSDPFDQNAGTFDDQIQMLVFLSDDATLEIEFNGSTTQYSASPGIDSFKVAAAAASAPVFRIIRDGRIIEEITGATDIADTYDVQDPTYFAGTSRNVRPLSSSASSLFVSAPWRYGNYLATGVDATLTPSELESPFPRAGITERPALRFESLDELITTGVGWSFLPVGLPNSSFIVSFDFYVESVDAATAGLRMVSELWGDTGFSTTSWLLYMDIGAGSTTGELGYIEGGTDNSVTAIDIQTWYRVEISVTGVGVGSTFEINVYEPAGPSDKGALISAPVTVSNNAVQTVGVKHMSWRNSGDGCLAAVHFDNVKVAA